MFNIDNHKKEILAVGDENKTIETKYKWNQLNIMDVQYLLGANRRIFLSHMDKSSVWLEETNQRINELSIEYMMNPNLIMKKLFREQVKICMKNTFSKSTMTHMSKILLKPNTIVLALVMFFEDRKKYKENI